MKVDSHGIALFGISVRSGHLNEYHVMGIVLTKDSSLYLRVSLCCRSGNSRQGGRCELVNKSRFVELLKWRTIQING